MSFFSALAYVDHVFNKQDGPLKKLLQEQRGSYKYNFRQHEYARAVARTLDAQGTPGLNVVDMSVLEAETGTGKTLGYLIPLLGWAAMNGKRVAVSTYTIHLQRQLHPERGDMFIAKTLARDILGKRLIVKPRFGLGNFISPGRVRLMLDRPELEEGVRAALSQMLRAIDDGESGLLQDWQDSHGDLPEGLSQEQIRCERWEKEHPAELSRREKASARDAEGNLPRYRNINHRQYEDACQEATASDVLVLNHWTLLLHGKMGFRLLDSEEERDLDGRVRRIGAVVVDEADRVPDAALQIYQRSCSLSRINGLLDDLDDVALNDALGAVLKQEIALGRSLVRESWNWFSEMDQQYPNAGRITKASHGDGFGPEKWAASAEHAQQVERALEAPFAAAQHIGLATLFGDDDRAQQYEHAAETLLETLSTFAKLAGKKVSTRTDDAKDKEDKEDKDREYFIPSLHWSADKRQPSFWLIPTNPGMLLSRYWRGNSYLDKAVITSATLSGDGSVMSMGRDIGDLGIFKKDINLVRIAAFQQDAFGKMAFTVSPKDAPSPSLREIGEEGEFVQTNPEWLDHVATLILGKDGYEGAAQSALRKRGAALVLTLSNKDGEEIAERLSALEGRLLRHYSGGPPLKTLLRLCETTPGAVLISAGCWEGLDAPGLWTDLVITRVPSPPPSAPALEAYRYRLNRLGQDEGVIKSKVFLKSASMARKKLRQGLGRGIRRASDSVRVWICDPRFTLDAEKSRQSRLYFSAIPDRFQFDDWLAREVFGQGPADPSFRIPAPQSRFRRMRTPPAPRSPDMHCVHPKP